MNQMNQAERLLLLVDDNAANLRILAVTFQEQKFKVLTATSVAAAQVLLKEHRDRINLVVSDIQMPVQTGFDLVRWMKEQANELGDIPILLVTSQLPEVESRILGLSLGAVDYVLRTLDPTELVIRVTHAIENYERVRDLRASLQDQESQALTGRLLAASGHEIKNLVSIIAVSASVIDRCLARESQPFPPMAAQAFASLKQSASLLASISRGMGQAPGAALANALVPLDLRQLLDETLLMMQPLLKNVDVRCDFLGNHSGHPTAWCKGSAVHLKQILVNLLLNARQAIAEAHAGHDGSDGKIGSIDICIDSRVEHDVSLTIKDNGVGFPAAETREDFAAFATTKQMRGGQGLGLWLCSSFAREMGGSLSLSSDGPGLGACARLRLAAAAPATGQTLDLGKYFLDLD